MPGDPLERDVVNVEFVALDQVEKEIELTFKNLEPDFVFGFHARPRH